MTLCLKLNMAEAVEADVSLPTAENQKEEEEDKYGLRNKIFVGNVGYRVGWKQLQEFFSKFGHVSYTHIVKDHLKKRPRGIAFVRFNTEEEADRVLMASGDELVLEGRRLRVNRAEESARMSFMKYDKIPDFDRQTRAVDSMIDTETTDGPGEGSRPNLNDLCDDVMFKIFAFLTIKERISLERVCHRWRHLSLQCWGSVKSLHFRNMFRWFEGVTDKILHSLLQRFGSWLTSLDLSASPRLLTNYALCIIGHFCPNLTYLDLSGAKVSNKSLKVLTTTCNKLKVIKLKKCLYVGEKGLWWVLHHCKELEVLKLESNSSVTGKCFHMAGPKLRELHLNGCSSLCDTGIFELVELCPLVEEVHLQSCVLLTGAAIKKLCTGFRKMTIFEATGSFPKTTIESWTSLGHLSNLVQLDLSMNVGVGDLALVCIAYGCSKLRVLDISNCQHNVTDAGFCTLSCLSNLECLSISYLHMVHDESLELIAANGQLKRLTAQACDGITDAGMSTVVALCSQLIHLDLSGNIQISNTTLSACLASVQEYPRRVIVHLGGTSVVVENVTVPSCMEVNLMDLSLYILRPDREFMLPEPYLEEDEEDFEDRLDPAGEFQPGGGEVGECPWIDEDDNQYDDLCDDNDNDNPINDERWELN